MQRGIDAHYFLAQAVQQISIDMTAPAIVDVDVSDAFPSIHKQPLFDALERLLQRIIHLQK